MRRSAVVFGSEPWTSRIWVQRELAGAQRHVHGVRLVHVHLDLLAAGQQIIGGEGVAMGDLVQPVRTRQEFHRAAGHRGVAEGDPGGDDIGRLEAPIVES